MCSSAQGRFLVGFVSSPVSHEVMRAHQIQGQTLAVAVGQWNRSTLAIGGLRIGMPGLVPQQSANIAPNNKMDLATHCARIARPPHLVHAEVLRRARWSKMMSLEFQNSCVPWQEDHGKISAFGSSHQGLHLEHEGWRSQAHAPNLLSNAGHPLRNASGGGRRWIPSCIKARLVPLHCRTSKSA